MNRRGFLEAILKAGAGAAILPGALTYARKWKFTGEMWVTEDPIFRAAEYVGGIDYMLYPVKELRSGFSCHVSSYDELSKGCLVQVGKWSRMWRGAYPMRIQDKCPMAHASNIHQPYGAIEITKPGEIKSQIKHFVDLGG